MSPPLRVGLIFPPKKLAQAGFVGIADAARAHNMAVTLVDLDRDIAAQGPFDLILHKLSETYLARAAGDATAAQRWARVEAYLAAQPAVPLLDPLASLFPLQSRTAIADALAALPSVRVPHAVTLALGPEAAAEPLRFPAIVKRVEACSTSASHIMCVAAGPRQWRAICAGGGPFALGEQVTVQELVPHGGVLVKVYVMGDEESGVYVQLRPSLRTSGWVDEGDAPALVFDSQTIPKRFPEHAPSPASLDAVQEAFLSATAEERARLAQELGAGRLHADILRLSREISAAFNLTLFGFDVVLHAETGDYYVVDVNYFPSFSGVAADFQDRFLRVVQKWWDTKAWQQRQQQGQK